jgi:hypothetical protein
MANNSSRLNYWIEFLHEKTEIPFDSEFLLEKARQHKAIRYYIHS